MAMPVPTAHTMMPKRRLDEVRTMLGASNFKALDSKFFGIHKSALLMLYDLVLIHAVCVSL